MLSFLSLSRAIPLPNGLFMADKWGFILTTYYGMILQSSTPFLDYAHFPCHPAAQFIKNPNLNLYVLAILGPGFPYYSLPSGSFPNRRERSL